LRGSGKGNQTVPSKRLRIGGIYCLRSPESQIGVWNGDTFIALSAVTGRLVELGAQATDQIGMISDPQIKLQAILATVCAYCGGNLTLEGESGQWKSQGACSCDPPSPRAQENYALADELEEYLAENQ
jgi:hypothetical protein